jgi:hypothetical protein
VVPGKNQWFFSRLVEGLPSIISQDTVDIIRAATFSDQ